jgi:hypothetical protein
MTYVVVKGSMAKGFDVFGPFPGFESAAAFYRLHEGSEILELRKPYDLLIAEGEDHGRHLG